MEWLENEISRGLSCLVVMRTPGCPPAEQVHNVARVWSGALVNSRKWDESQDVDRIREAFRQIVLSAKRWPTVSEFLDVLPMRGAAPAQTVPVQRQLEHNTKIDARGDATRRAEVLARFNQRMSETMRDPERIARMEEEREGVVRHGKKIRIPWTDEEIYGEWQPLNSLDDILSRIGAKV